MIKVVFFILFGFYSFSWASQNETNNRIAISVDSSASLPETFFSSGKERPANISLPNPFPLPKEIKLRSRFVFEDKSAEPLPIQLAREGGTHGGGGGGVACYAPGAAKNEASLLSIYVLEYWESSLPGDLKYYSPFENESATQYLFRNLNREFTNIAPEFLRVLNAAITEVSSQLNQCKNLQYSNDRGEYIMNDQQAVARRNCAFVQLAWRSPITNGAKIEYNCDLYARLGDKNGSGSSKIINQATLLLHEALYLIGARLGSHLDSVQVRRLTNWLLFSKTTPPTIQFFRDNLRKWGFDDFFRLSLNMNNAARYPMIESRQKSYSQLVLLFGNLRRLVVSMNVDAGPTRDALFLNDPRTSRYLFVPDIARRFNEGVVREILPQLSDEEAFLFMASILSEITPMNFESLLTAGSSDKEITQAVCRTNSRSALYTLGYDLLYSKVQNYCAKL